jgi:hypothetical protein
MFGAFVTLLQHLHKLRGHSTCPFNTRAFHHIVRVMCVLLSPSSHRQHGSGDPGNELLTGSLQNTTCCASGTVVCIPDQPPSGLIPPKGLLHQSFPALVLSEYSERAPGGKRRKAAVSRQKRPSVSRRRAISELMVRLGTCHDVAWHYVE